MSFYQQLFSHGQNADLKSLIEQGAFLVDVRTSGEFAEGNIKGSVNVPLDRIPSQLSQFKHKKSIIVFCRTGNRSGQAKTILDQNGFTDVVNGGTMGYVNQFVK